MQVDLFSMSELMAQMHAKIDAADAEPSPSDAAAAEAEGGAEGGGKAAGGRRQYANTLWAQVCVLVRRMYVVDLRNPAYVIAWFLNCFVLLLQGLTYVVIVQPPSGFESLASYRTAFASAGTCDLAEGSEGSTVSEGGLNYTINEDVVECGSALVSLSGLTSHRSTSRHVTSRHVT